ncbi:nucleoside 2-deoxyribosyltransferase [Candidatus Parcubacteria bacterium]|nr:nucleoside 2-deoxyribosyltransferase [Candidatus Parcubacteria bacterium]
MGLEIYLAGPWADRHLMPEIASKFEAIGCVCTHKWWEIEDVDEVERTPALLRKQAEMDRDGVEKAKLMILINSSKSEGKAVEQGIAIANHIPIIAVGKRGEFSKNVFHYLPLYFWSESIEAVLPVVDFIANIVNNFE